MAGGVLFELARLPAGATFVAEEEPEDEADFVLVVVLVDHEGRSWSC
jgi:hypothetical protein